MFCGAPCHRRVTTRQELQMPEISAIQTEWPVVLDAEEVSFKQFLAAFGALGLCSQDEYVKFLRFFRLFRLGLICVRHPFFCKASVLTSRALPVKPRPARPAATKTYPLGRIMFHFQGGCGRGEHATIN